MTATVATKKWPGLSSGKVICRNVCQPLAPSIAAAS